MSGDRWTVKTCPLGHLNEAPNTICLRCAHQLGQPFEVMRVPDLEGSGQARRSDPGTAKAAGAIKVNRGSQRWRVLEALHAAGEHGATSHELEEATGIRYASLTPRIGELKNGGLIVATDRTRRGRYGVDQEVLRIPEPRAYKDVDDEPAPNGDEPAPNGDALSDDDVDTLFDA